MLEGLDAIAQPGRLLVAEVPGQVGEAFAKTGQRPVIEETVELLGRARGERARREGCPAAARDRAELGRGLGDDEVLAPALQVHAVLLPAAAGVGRRLELADQAHLLERGFQLGAEHAPLDPLERE